MSNDLSALFNESVGDDDDDFFKVVGVQPETAIRQPSNQTAAGMTAAEHKREKSMFRHPRSPQSKSPKRVVFDDVPKFEELLKPSIHSPVHRPVTSPAALIPPPVLSTTLPSDPLVPSPPVSSPPKSLIAARRAAAASAEPVLIKPQQDVIYKQYTPHAPVVVGPPPVLTSPHLEKVPVIATCQFPLVSPPGPAYLHQGSTAAPQSIIKTPPPQQSAVLPSLGPVASVSPSLPLFPPMHSVPPAPSFSAQTYSLSPPPAAHRPEGLQAKVHIGFGGRIVMFGGKKGMKVSMTTIFDSFNANKETKKYIDIIRSAPVPLGAVTSLCTEQLISWIDSIRENKFIADQELLLLFLRDRLSTTEIKRGINRNQKLIVKIAENNELLKSSTLSQSVLSQFIFSIIRGDFRDMIEIAKINSSLLPFSMAFASIHSAEFFRESVLAFANSVGRESANLVSTNQSADDSILIEILKQVIIIFASTSGAHRLDISPFTVEHWDLFLCLISSLLKPNSGTDSNAGIFLLRLGDHLIQSNKIGPGQLCILLSGKKDNVLDSVDSHDGLISLIGVNHRSSLNFSRLVDPVAIMLSEVYEYTWRMAGSTDVCVPLQPFKFVLAANLASDFGMFETAEKYLEIVHAFIRAVPTNRYSVSFRNALRELEQRIAGTRPSLGQPQREAVGGIGQATFGAIWGGITAVARTSLMTRRNSESLNKSTPISVDRKSVLDSLVKRRRENTTRSKLLSTPFESENSESDSNSSDDNFVVSDSGESIDDGRRKKQRVDSSADSGSSDSSSESSSSDSSSDSSNSSCDYGFYARVSSLIDKKREKLKTIADTMSPRQAFQLCMQYYAMCLVSRGCKYPEKSENKKLARILPELKVAVRRVERELMSRRDNIRPSYWKDESLLVRATQRYPILELIDHRGFYHHKHNEEPCAACNRMGWSWEVRFRGDEYNSKGLWLGEISEWVKAMGLEPLGKAKMESEEDDESGDEDYEVTEYISRRIELGSQCAKNVEIYHALQHSKNFFIREIYDFIKNSKIEDSLTRVVRTFKNPKNHFFGKLYEKYNELIQLSESRFDFDDHNEPGQTIKLTPKQKHSRHSNRF